MGLFDNILGQFIDVIEWLDPTNDTIIYRFQRHNNEIKQGAKLIVRPGQQAIFVNEGQIADIFQPGTYELYTKNLPILSTLKAWPYGFNSPYKAEVYFVNTKIFTNLKWGTSNPIPMRDADFGVVRIRAYGNYSIRINEPGNLLKTLVSTDGLFQVDEVQDHLRNIIITEFASWLGKAQIPLLNFASHYADFGEQVRQGIQPQMQEIGVELTGLYIENVSVPPSVEEAIDKRSSMGILGNLQDYAQYQAANAIEESAKNPGSGNMGLEFGVGMAMAQKLNNTFNTPAPAPASAPPPPIIQWFIAQNGQPVGPLTPDQLRQQGITRETLVWHSGLPGWTAAAQIPELAPILPPPPPPAL